MYQIKVLIPSDTLLHLDEEAAIVDLQTLWEAIGVLPSTVVLLERISMHGPLTNLFGAPSIARQAHSSRLPTPHGNPSQAVLELDIYSDTPSDVRDAFNDYQAKWPYPIVWSQHEVEGGILGQLVGVGESIGEGNGS